MHIKYTPLTKTNDNFKSVLDWESGELGSSPGSGHRQAMSPQASHLNFLTLSFLILKRRDLGDLSKTSVNANLSDSE